MEKKSKISQIYGYAVCLVAIITFLVSLSAIITNLIDAKDPLFSRTGDQKLSSYENFKVETLKTGQNEMSYIPDEETLVKMYVDLKNHKIKTVVHQTNKTIIVNSIMFVLSILLFIFHWIWLRRIDKQEK